MRANRVLRILVVAAGVLAISAMVVSALNPDAYFYYRTEDRAQWHFELVPVLVVCLYAASEAAVAYFAVWFAQRVRLWLSALLGCTALLLWWFFLSQTVVHMPGFYLLNLVWLSLLLVFLGVCTLVSGGAQVLRFFRKPRVV